MSAIDHETVSFTEFLDYRARRLKVPVIEGAPAPPDAVTTPPDSSEPGRQAVARAAAVARDPRV